MAEETGPKAQPPKAHKVHFWGTFVALCLLAFISALDVAIITTALPTITAEIGGSTEYVWIANSFVVAACVLQPLIGQLADILGRRIPFIGSIILFALGSGIAGGASNVGMLIAGRTVQGAGAGGIYVLLDIVCCDLVPLRERGKYLGLMFSWSGVGAALGPPVGGAIAQKNWRWIFYLNIPICGVALAAVLIFMRVKNRQADVKKVDYLGNLIFIPSMIAILLGLVMGGIQHPWSSWRIIVPLILGGIGWIVFHIQQVFASSPSVPTRLFTNRTSATAFALTFFSAFLVQSATYFLPVWFQAVLGVTVLNSGVYFLPFAIGTLVSAVISGILLSKFGAYRPIHAGAFALSAIGFGLFTILNTSTARWVIFQLIASAGMGSIMSVLLPAIMASLSESDVAASSAVYSFIRTFGYVWGVTVPSIMFNAVFNKNLWRISSPKLRAQLADGAAYAFASEAHRIRNEVPPALWREVVYVYTKSLKTIWWFGLGMSIVGFLAVGLERSIELRKDLETEYGLEDRDKRTTEENATTGGTTEANTLSIESK